MKILFLGDASNFNATLAPAMAQLGHSVTVASAGGGWMQTRRHIDISRADNRLAGARLYWKMLSNADLGSGYDAVFLCDTSFVTLKPHRLLEIFKRLKRRNGKVFLSALGTNALLVQNLTGSSPALPFSEWQTPWGQANKNRWLRPELLDYTLYVYEHVDGIATALYEYDAVARAIVPGQNIVYTGIPVEPPAATDIIRPEESLRIMVAVHPGREAEKGIDRLMPVVFSALHHFDRPVEMKLAAGMPFSQFRKELAQFHIVIDQYYALSPATTALMAMRGGVVPVTGGHPDWLRFIGADSAPLIATDPRDPEATARAIVGALPRIAELAAAAPGFALANTPEAVARRFNTFL